MILGKVEGLSLSNAMKLVPKEFGLGYDWFCRHRGEVIPALPYGRNTPKEVSYPLSRMAGIHSPGKSQMHYPGKQYALSVHSSDPDRYDDSAPVIGANGGWTFRYCGQDNDASSTMSDFNGWLINCLEDGVPVGVMTKQPAIEGGGYKVWGLAYVIAYEDDNNVFWMKGPVTVDVELQ